MYAGLWSKRVNVAVAGEAVMRGTGGAPTCIVSAAGKPG